VASAREARSQTGELRVPRNQVAPPYSASAGKSGVATAGTRGWTSARSEERESLFRRGVRLADAYVPLTGRNSNPHDGTAARR